MTIAIALLTGLVMLGVGLVACGSADDPQVSRYAATLCGAFERCGCGFWFSSTDACEAEMVARFNQAAEGRLVDATCVDGYLAELEGAHCDDTTWFYDPAVICVAIQGDRRHAESCTEPRGLPFLPVKECQEGLSCAWDGVCTLPEAINPGLRAEGDTCDPQIAPFCDPTLYCGEDNRCHPHAGPGDPCTSAFACPLATHYCAGLGDGTPGVCTERLALDAPCDPREYQVCAAAEDGDSLRSCSPTLGRCVAEAQAICGPLSHPWLRPVAGGG